MYDEDSNLESMLNNPFQNLSPGKSLPRKQAQPVKTTASGAAEVERPMERAPDAGASRVERNHPLELRVLGLEKDMIIAAKRMDDLKRIIERQNERIQLLEEELDILRKELGKEGK